MNQKITLKNLDKFGLNSYEAKSYLSLLEKSQLTASEVSRLAGIPRARVYETLENLEKRGFCRVVPGKVKMYTAVDPSLLKDVIIETEREKLEYRIQKLKDEIKKEEDQLDERIKDAQNLADELSPIFEKGRSKDESLDYIELIKDENHVQKRVCQLIEAAEKEVIALSKAPLMEDREKVLDQLDLEKKSLDKGVPGKCVYEVPNTPEKIRWLREYADIVSGLGEEVRVIETLPIKFVVFDDKSTVFQLEDPISFKPTSTHLIIHHRSFARSLRMLFNMIWNESKNLDEFDNIVSEISKKENETESE